MTQITLEDIAAFIKRHEQAAYKRGWDDAVAHVKRALQIENPAPKIRLRLRRPRPVVRRVVPDDQGEPGSVISVILGIINEHPGMRGSEIMREAVSRIPGSNFKTMDRTGRTALGRLLRRGLVESRERRWYPREGGAKK